MTCSDMYVLLKSVPIEVNGGAYHEIFLKTVLGKELYERLLCKAKFDEYCYVEGY